MKDPKGTLRTILILIIVATSFSIGLWFIFLNTGLYPPPTDPTESWVLRNGLIWDATGQAVFRGDILIQDGTIVQVGPEIEVPANARILELKGKAVLPGLIDLNVQFYAPSQETRDLSAWQQLPEYVRQRPSVRKNILKAGVTTIRCLGDIPANIAQLQQQIVSGRLAGPRIFTAGALITGPGGYPIGSQYAGNQMMIDNATFQVRSPEEMTEAVSSLLSSGGNGINFVYYADAENPQALSAELLEAGVVQAQQKGAWTHIFAGNKEEVSLAASLGVNSIAFGGTEPWDSLYPVANMLEEEVVFLPMLTQHSRNKILLENVALWDRVGGRLGIGTGFHPEARYGESTLLEMESLVAAGASTNKVLQGATIEAARCLEMDQNFGTITPGKWADIIVVSGKPWQQIQDLRKIEYVFQGGKLLLEAGRLKE